MKEKWKLYIVIGIIILIVSVVGISFAFIGRGSAENNLLNITGTVIESERGYYLSYEGNNTLNVSLDMEVLASATASNDYTSYAESSSNVTVNLLTDLNVYHEGVTCMYSLYYVPSVSYTPSSAAASNGLTELAFVSKEANKEGEFVTPLDNLSEKIKITSAIISTSASNNNVQSTWNIALRFYNLSVDQQSALGQNPSGNISFEIDNCYTRPLPELAEYIKNDVYTGSNPEGTAGLYYHASAESNPNYLANGAKDNTYRYSGADADVNNYVCFAGDDCADINNLYRIISVDSTTNQTKVIKATSIGNMAWDKKADGSYVNSWEGSSLEKYLNGIYLTSLGQKVNKIETTTWYVGGYTSSQMTSSIPQAIYGIEKADTTTYPKKIGLMYASEYGFAALPEFWSNVIGNNSTNGYNLSKTHDWMLTTTDYYPWTISRRSDDSHAAFIVSSERGDVNSNYVNSEAAVRPSFALSSNVKITNVDTLNLGSKDAPMIII